MTEYLAIVFLSLFIFLLTIMIIGMIEPKWILRWSKNPTRLKVLGWWVLSEFLCIGACIACFFIETEKDAFPIPQMNETTGKWGYVENRKKVIPFVYDEADSFSFEVDDKAGDFVAKVKLKGKYGYINKKGDVVIPLIYDEIENCNIWNDSRLKVKINNKYGFYYKTGQEVVPPVYDDINLFVDDLAVVISFGKKGLINRTGKEIVPPVYDKIESFVDDLAVVVSNGKKGLINRTGKEIVPPVYDEIGGFVDDLAGVIVNGKKGFINRTGQEVVPPTYEVTGYYFSGMEKVGLNGKYGFIDKTGKVAIPIMYDHIGEFQNNLAPVKSKGKFGYINKEGEVIIPLKYDDAEDFVNGYANVRIAQSAGRIDTNGKFSGQSVRISLLEAVKKKYVRFSAYGSSIQSSKIIVENMTDLKLQLSIPAGTFLSAKSSGYQNMVLTDPSDIDLDARDTHTEFVSTACMNIHRNIPGGDNSFGIAQHANNHLLTKVIKLLKDGNYTYSVEQAAVWIVTDGATYSGMGILQNQNRQRIISNEDYNQAVSIVNQAKKMK